VTDTAAPASNNTCPQCHAHYDVDDRFCHSCGHQLVNDAACVEAQLARILPGQIDAALASRLREQKVVEVETAQLLAERAVSWLKLLGFFVGLPIVAGGIVLAFLGFKTYSDFQSYLEKAARFEKVLTTAEQHSGEINKRVTELDAALVSAHTQIDRQLAQIGKQQKDLQAQVSTIQQRLRFCPSKGLSAELKNSLQNKLAQFIGYLEKVGFQNLDKQISVCVYSKDDPIQDPNLRSRTDQNAFYMTQDRTIYIHRDLAPVPSVALREYTHYALLTAANGNTALHRSEIESGLADYFPASFLDNPLIGDKLGALFNLPTPYIRNLANTMTYPAGAEEHTLGEAWDGAIWQCRQQLGAQVTDKLVLQAWKDFALKHSDNVKAFSAALIKGEADDGKRSLCFADQIKQRRLSN
jgi:hypothetical protein